MEKLLALSVPGYGQIEAPGQVPTGGISGTGSNILQVAITFLFLTAVVVALFMLIYSGIQWMMSKGDKTKLESARLRIMFSIIGLVVIFLSFFVVNVVGTVFGVKLLDLGPLGLNTGSDLGTYQNTDQTDNTNQNTQNNKNKKNKNKKNKNNKKKKKNKK